MKKVFLYLCLIMLCFLSGTINAQENERITISGTISSSEGGVLLAGVSVSIKGNKTGIASKADGTFSIQAYKGQTIEFTSVGFEKQELRVNKSDNIQIIMKFSPVESQEIVVIGYGTRKKSHLTGSVTKVVNDNLGQIPVSRADQALQGKLAGVNITTTDAQAGAAPTIQIRGATSITAGSDPLIVIDGYPVPTDLSAVDMNDVESIEVLKDAASAAIYGSRGGNGVILITTKSGKVGTGKISASISSGTKNVYRKIPFSSVGQWKQFVLADNGGVLPASGEILQAEKFNANTSAQDVIFRQGAFTNLQLSASGGTTQFKYYLSANGMIDDGVMLGNNHKKLGMKAGFSAKVNSKVTIDFGFTPSYEETYVVGVNVAEAMRSLSPWMPLYHTDTTAFYTGMAVGSITNSRDFYSLYNPNYTGPNLAAGTSNNPLLQLNGISNKTTQVRNIANFSVKVDFSKYLSFKSSFGFLYSDITKEFFQKSWAQSEAAIDGAAFAQLSTKAILGSTKRIDVSNENIFNYKRILKKHDLDIIGGFSTQYSNIATSSAQAGNFATDNISTLNAGTMQYMTSDIQEDPLLSVLMRINYAYANKYLLSVSNRADESGKFAPGNRWGYFPSISAGWRVSSEKFFPDNKYVNDVKIRASYGATGNNKIGNYKYFAAITPAYASLGSEASPGYQQTSLPNNLLGWERTFSTNLGVDLGLFNNKLKLSVEYYNSTTDQLLLDLPIVASTGYSTYTMNKGKVSNKGIEFEISMPIINKGKFKWTVTANGSANKNELLDFGGTDKQINQGDPKRANFYLTQVGQPLTQYFGYKVDSVVPIRNTNYWPIDVTSFHAFARDINKDGKITPEDRVVLGDPYPKFIWGLTTNFQYKQFDISLTFQGSVGAKVFNIDPYYLGSEYTTTGVSALNSQGYDSMTLSRKVIKTQTDIFIQDASFIALRNLNIGYTLSPKLAKKMKIQKVRFYMTASNLWYHFADNYTSLNPEADNAFPNDPLRKGYQRGGVPLARTITFGANFDF